MIILLGMVYDTIRPVFPQRAPYAFIEKIQSFFQGKSSADAAKKSGKSGSPGVPSRATALQGLSKDGKILTTNVYKPGESYQNWVWAVKPDYKTGRIVRVEMAHAAAGETGGFTILAFADTDGDGKPDRKITESEFLTTEEANSWSTFTFTTTEEKIFIGNSWPPDNETVIFRGNGPWPVEDSPLEGRFYYHIAGPNSRSAGPTFTNLRVSFID